MLLILTPMNARVEVLELRLRASKAFIWVCCRVLILVLGEFCAFQRDPSAVFLKRVTGYLFRPRNNKTHNPETLKPQSPKPQTERQPPYSIRGDLRHAAPCEAETLGFEYCEV